MPKADTPDTAPPRDTPDGRVDDKPENRARLSYPFSAPTPGQGVEVAPGVHWLRLPLPYALDHINVWALDDGNAGWAMVDTGTRTPEVAAAWRAQFARYAEGPQGADGRSISRVFVTHMHPDHVGMAGWLTRKFGVRLWMTRLEYLTCRVMTSDTGREAPQDAISFYQRAGWNEAAIEAYRTRFGSFGNHIHALPDSYRRLRDGDVIRIGANDWQVIVGSGHSPEHACLYCPALKLLISGDQVLPRISSNVSVNPIEPEADPMADWLASLDKVQAAVPDDVLVLPSHNDCFRGLHARIEALRRGQGIALDRLRRSLAEPKRAVDVFGALFARPIGHEDAHLLGMATGESMACLNHLLQRGEAVVQPDANGVNWYRLAGQSA